MKFIYLALSSPGWVEESKDISNDIKLSKRELLGLILISHAMNARKGNWHVGYDPDDGDQNDGHVTDGNTKFIIEHKVVAQMDKKGWEK